jgi:hypothetical protein
LAGLEWYFVLTLPCLALAFLFARFLFRELGRPRWVLVYFATVAVLVAWELLRLYRGPAVRVFDPLLGFFAGSLYDEALPLPRALLWHQLMVMALAGSFLALEVRRRRLALSALVVAAALFANGRALGFRFDRQHLAATLSAAAVTPHLVLHYAPRGRVANALQRVWTEAEFHATRVATALKVEPAEATHVFLYESEVEKEALMGARRTLFTRPWVPEIHLLYDGPALSGLEHELVHAFAREWNQDLVRLPMRYGVLPQMGLIEGLAVAVAPPAAWPLHEAMAALKHNGREPDLEPLLAGYGFYADSGERAYTAAGSFMAWLRERRGIEVLRAAYASGNLGEAAGVSVATLLRDYDAFLATVPISPELERFLEEQLREKPLYARVCGRELAERREAFERALAAGDVDGAEALLASLRHDDPNDRSLDMSALELARRRAWLGMDGERYEKQAQELLQRDDLPRLSRLHLDEDLADWAVANGRADKARDWLTQAQTAVNAPDDERRVALKLVLLDRHLARELFPALRRDAGEASALVRLGDVFHAAPFDPTVNYLYARRLSTIDDLPRALAHLDSALQTGGLPAAARFEAARLAAQWSIDAGDLAGIQARLAQLDGNAHTTRDKATAFELRSRADFYRGHPTW